MDFEFAIENRDALTHHTKLTLTTKHKRKFFIKIILKIIEKKQTSILIDYYVHNRLHSLGSSQFLNNYITTKKNEITSKTKVEEKTSILFGEEREREIRRHKRSTEVQNLSSKTILFDKVDFYIIYKRSIKRKIK